MKLIHIVFLFICSQFIFSEINITTIDSYKIVNLGKHHLLISKFSEDPNSNNGFFIQMKRPFCLCEEPTFIFENPKIKNFLRPKEDSRISGKLKIDFNKTKDVELEVYLASPESTNNVLSLKGNFPSLRKAKYIEIETIYGIEKFVLEGFESVMKQATKMCESFIPYIPDEETKSKGTKV